MANCTRCRWHPGQPVTNRQSMRSLFLSWSLEPVMPLYPGTPSLIIQAERVLAVGDSCNRSLLTLSNHSGTHIDAPAHFITTGRTVDSYSPEELRFSNPLLLDVSLPDDKGIKPQELEVGNFNLSADLLLIRTCACHYRSADPSRYSTNGPWLTPEAAHWIRQSFPRLRAVGIDTVSIASPQHRAEGWESHRILLGTEAYATQPLLIIEDMDLTADLSGLCEVMLAPLRFSGLDGAPATVIGYCNV